MLEEADLSDTQEEILCEFMKLRTPLLTYLDDGITLTATDLDTMGRLPQLGLTGMTSVILG